MFIIGGLIRDQQNTEWVIAGIWQFDDWLCLALVGRLDPEMMGGTRVAMRDLQFIRQ